MNGDYRQHAELAMQLAGFYDAELTLLHIPDRDVVESIQPGLALAWAENLTADLLPAISPHGAAAVRVSVAFGDRVREIRDEAARMHADWIVLGVGDGGAPMWPLRETTAYRTLAIAHSPVLAIRRGAEARQETPVGSRAELKQSYENTCV
jgi:nucleotide-binding universal stress UspA family protein